VISFLMRLSFFPAFGVLSVVGLLLYGHVVSYPFVHDDYVFIVQNLELGRWGHLKDIFLNPSFSFPNNENIVNSYYRPILDIVNKGLFVVFQRVPRGYHLFNILIHIVNSFFVYVLAMRLSKKTLFSLSVSLFFLIHPVQTEAVCAIAGISNLLFALFCFLSLFFYLKHEEDSSLGASIASLSLSLLFFLLALLTKESAVALPAIIIFYEFIFKGLKNRGKKPFAQFFSFVPFFCLLAGYFGFRQVILHRALPDLTAGGYELWMRIASIPQTLLMYLRILVVPSDLHYYRSVDILKFSFVPSLILIGLGIAVFAILKLLPREEKRLACFGLALFLITLAPMLNIVPLINEYSLILTAEHFLYFSLFGFLLFFFVVAKQVLHFLFKQNAEKFVVAGMILIGIVFFFAARGQTRYWQGEIPLFQRTLHYYPNFGRVRILLARAYYFDHRSEAAITEYQKGIFILEGYLEKTKGLPVQKTYRFFIKEAYFELAHCYEAREQFKKAIFAYRQALKMDSGDDRIYNNLGIDYLSIGNLNQAALCFKNAIAVNPQNVMALNNLAFYYLQNGKLNRAEEILKRVLRLDPESVSAQRNFEEILKAKKQTNDKNLRKP